MTFNTFQPYHPNHYKARRINRDNRIEAGSAVRAFMSELVKTDYFLPVGFDFSDGRIRSELEAEWLITRMNTPDTHFASLLHLQSPHQYWQRLVYIPSNLGKGFLFYFLCNGCDKRMKYLYKPDDQEHYKCRDCYRLSYPTPQQRQSSSRIE